MLWLVLRTKTALSEQKIPFDERVKLMNASKIGMTIFPSFPHALGGNPRTGQLYAKPSILSRLAAQFKSLGDSRLFFPVFDGRLLIFFPGGLVYREESPLSVLKSPLPLRKNSRLIAINTLNLRSLFFSERPVFKGDRGDLAWRKSALEA